MALNETYGTVEPDRTEIAVLTGPVLIEFGNSWCGHCSAAQPFIAAAMENHPRVQHIKIADGPGRRLGRAFKVKLWPTLVFLDGGEEKSRLIRPASSLAIAEALATIDGTG